MEEKREGENGAAVIADFKTFMGLLWDFSGDYSLELTITTLLKL